VLPDASLLVKARGDSLNAATPVSPTAETATPGSAIQAGTAAGAPLTDSASARAEGGAVEPDPRGEARGIVLSEEEGTAVAKVAVQYVGEKGTFVAETDAAGLYRVRGVSPGVYRLQLFRKGYEPLRLDDVVIGPEGDKREVRLRKRVLRGRTMQVALPQRSGSEAALRQQRQKGGVVMEGVSAEQISRGTDSDAGAIARRVTGTSLVGGKFVFVRGLGERYTNMTLNGLPVPSPEKEKRVVPQDLFPASALESFAIFKTFSPELPPDFAGGSVALNLKGIPDKDFFEVSAGVGGEVFPGTGDLWRIGQTRLSYRGGGAVTEYLGWDDGTRSYPEGVPEVVANGDLAEDRAVWARKFNNFWSLDSGVVLPNQSLGITWGKVVKVSERERWGGLLSGAYSNKYRDENSVRYKMDYAPVRVLMPRRQTPDADCAVEPEKCALRSVKDTVNDTTVVDLLLLDPPVRQETRLGEFSTRTTLMGNVGWQTPDNFLWLKGLYAHLSTDKAYYNWSESYLGAGRRCSRRGEATG